jgi:hypothetical protein
MFFGLLFHRGDRCMSCLKHGVYIAFALLLTAGAIPAMAQATSGYLYVEDNGYQFLDRYSYSWDGVAGHAMSFDFAGNSAGSAKWIDLTANGNQGGGIAGTAKDIVVVSSQGISRYDFNGNQIGTNQAITSTSGGSYTLNNPGQVSLSADGKFAYVTESTQNLVDKIDLNTGKIAAQATVAGAQAVTVLPDGTVLVSSATGGGVVRYDANLANNKQVVAPTSNFYSQGLSSATGLTYVGDATSGKLYVQQNNGPTAGAMFSFNLTLNNGDVLASPSAAYQGSASLDTGTQSAQVKNQYASEIGADGQLYTAAFGSGDINNFSSYFGYTDGIYKYDIQSPTASSSLSISGGTFGFGPSGPQFTTPGDLFAPKYIAFDNNFIYFNDAGTPEPGTEALMVSMVGAGFIAIRRRRRKINAAK